MRQRGSGSGRGSAIQKFRLTHAPHQQVAPISLISQQVVALRHAGLAESTLVGHAVPLASDILVEKDTSVEEVGSLRLSWTNRNATCGPTERSIFGPSGVAKCPSRHWGAWKFAANRSRQTCMNSTCFLRSMLLETSCTYPADLSSEA